MKDKLEYICFICKQKARNLKILDTHIKQSHKGVKLYLCPCNKSFDRKQVYKDHMNSKHFMLRVYNCERGCSKEFLSHNARTMHYRKKHRDSYISQ